MLGAGQGGMQSHARVFSSPRWRDKRDTLQRQLSLEGRRAAHMLTARSDHHRTISRPLRAGASREGAGNQKKRKNDTIIKKNQLTGLRPLRLRQVGGREVP